jgi:hypothetical protein
MESDNDILEAFINCLSKLPYSNRHLLVYILNFLNQLSLSETKTQMGISNLSSIFQPSILTHSQHQLEPKEYFISQKVVEFMIQNVVELRRLISTEFDLIPSRSNSSKTILVKDMSSKRKCRDFTPEFRPTRTLSLASRLSNRVSLIGSSSESSSIFSNWENSSIVNRLSCII